MTDSLTTFEAAEADRADRMDEARRELDYTEATQIARGLYQGQTLRELAIFIERISRRGAHVVLWYDHGEDNRWRQLADFAEHYGYGALLFVLAKALEAQS